jgi:hypothetical protein
MLPKIVSDTSHGKGWDGGAYKASLSPPKLVLHQAAATTHNQTKRSMI